MQVLGRLDRLFAQIVFQSKYDAIEAFGELHGCNIYDGCCQLDIQYGVHIEFDVLIVTSDGTTVASSSSTFFPAGFATMSILDDLSSEMLHVHVKHKQRLLLTQQRAISSTSLSNQMTSMSSMYLSWLIWTMILPMSYRCLHHWLSTRML